MFGAGIGAGADAKDYRENDRFPPQNLQTVGGGGTVMTLNTMVSLVVGTEM